MTLILKFKIKFYLIKYYIFCCILFIIRIKYFKQIMNCNSIVSLEKNIKILLIFKFIIFVILIIFFDYKKNSIYCIYNYVLYT